MNKSTSFISCIAAVGLISLTGCASIVSGTKQKISVNTGQVKEANCTLENNKGQWYLKNTPGTVTVHRSFHDLAIDCEKKGYKSTHKQIASNTRPIAFGNVLFGGIFGGAVDVADGAAYN